jgi:hypothetical protein
VRPTAWLTLVVDLDLEDFGQARPSEDVILERDEARRIAVNIAKLPERLKN